MRRVRSRRSGVALAGLILFAAWVPAASAVAGFDTVDAPRPSYPGPKVWKPGNPQARDSTFVQDDRMQATVAAAADSIAAAADVGAERTLSDRRRDGATTPRRQWRDRWPVHIAALPFVSDAFDFPVSLDAGIPFAAWPMPSTDRTVLSSTVAPFGVANAAATIAVPAPPEGDPFLVEAWDVGTNGSPRGALAGPGALLAGPEPDVWWRRPLLDPLAATEPTTSALLYEKGDRGMEHTGARFAAPGLARGFAGAFTRRVSEGDDAFVRALETRYAVAVNLRRAGAARAWLEGSIADRLIESEAIDQVVGRAKGSTRHLALHALHARGSSDVRVTLRLARRKHTQIDPLDGARERWDEPSASLLASGTTRFAPAWTGMISAMVASGTIRSRAGPAVVFGGVLDASREIRRRDARVTVGVRRGAPRARTTWGADVAFDARRSDESFFDARISMSARSTRAAARFDLESTHQRATWEDRASPTRVRDYANLLVIPQAIRYRTESDPDLRPRRLSGVVGRASWSPRGRLRLHATGSVRYVADDFGWDVTRLESVDSIIVLEQSGRRGSGWNQHLSVGATWSVGALRLGSQGWIRGGALGPSDGPGPSPRAASPARAGLDVDVSARAVLFEGDLPLTLGVEAHVAGERDGLLRAPSIVTLDGSLRADFTDAGLFFRFEDLLDRRPPSGVYDLATGAGVPMPGRRFHLGVIWHLFD